MKRVRRTMPPTCGAEMVSRINTRCISPILRPEKKDSIRAMVTTPMPPIWMRTSSTPWPKRVQVVAVSRTMRPVTHTAEVAVNRQSPKGTEPGARLAKGSESRQAPRRISSRKPPTMTW